MTSVIFEAAPVKLPVFPHEGRKHHVLLRGDGVRIPIRDSVVSAEACATVMVHAADSFRACAARTMTKLSRPLPVTPIMAQSLRCTVDIVLGDQHYRSWRLVSIRASCKLPVFGFSLLHGMEPLFGVAIEYYLHDSVGASGIPADEMWRVLLAMSASPLLLHTAHNPKGDVARFLTYASAFSGIPRERLSALYARFGDLSSHLLPASSFARLFADGIRKDEEAAKRRQERSVKSAQSKFRVVTHCHTGKHEGDQQ